MSNNHDEQLLVGGRPVADLKVVELRKELEIRSLPKSGNKKELIERLEHFLLEERAELSRQNQQPQAKTSETMTSPESPSKSPNPVAMPNVVAQYLAQQQIQLEEARRSADKARATTSAERTTMVQSEIPITPESQQTDENARKSEEIMDRVKLASEHQQEDHAIFIPDEPIEKATTDKREVEFLGQKEGLNNPEQQDVRVEEEQQTGTGASTDDEASLENEVEDAGVEKYEEQVTEPVQDEDESKQMEEEDKGSEVYEQEELSKSVDDEIVTKEQKIGIDKAENTNKNGSFGAAETELENEDDEEREEPSDYAGKRHARYASPEIIGRKEAMEHNLLTAERGISSAASAKVNEPSNDEDKEISNEPAQVVASMIEESSKPSEQQHHQETTTPEGFVRRRAASPARNPASRWIHIRNLKRPFTKTALLDLLGKFGVVDPEQFWMDSIKSNCIVTYESVEQAQMARDHLHNVVWPTASDMSLCVEFTTNDKLKRRKTEEERDLAANSSSVGGLGLTIVVDNRNQPVEPMPGVAGPTVLVQHDKDQQKLTENRKRKVEELEKSQKTLDDLFKKTATLPAIYFLPLSEAEASKRKKHTSSSGGGKTQSSSSSHHRPAQSSSSSRHRHPDTTAGSSSSRRSGGRNSTANHSSSRR